MSDLSKMENVSSSRPDHKKPRTLPNLEAQLVKETLQEKEEIGGLQHQHQSRG